MSKLNPFAKPLTALRAAQDEAVREATQASNITVKLEALIS